MASEGLVRLGISSRHRRFVLTALLTRSLMTERERRTLKFIITQFFSEKMLLIGRMSAQVPMNMSKY